jgi:hypothetical protein
VVSRKYDYIMVKKQSSFLSIHTFNNRNWIVLGILYLRSFRYPHSVAFH